MSDDDLDAKLSRMPGSYEAEFDIERGLDRLRAAGHGVQDTGDGADEADMVLGVASVGASRSGSMVEVLGADLRIDSVPLTAPVALSARGTRLKSGQMYVDVTEYEDGPSEDSFLVLSRRPLSAGELADLKAVRIEFVTPQTGETRKLTGASALAAGTALFSAAVVAGVALVAGMPELIAAVAASAATLAFYLVNLALLRGQAARSKGKPRKDSDDEHASG
ncbi:hypothetical protein AB0N89_01195 [Amycolatopsis sp. NPDC089917]|uniref:hypothetical protein n=1 Tax=Amycolatopsis sp. NPDC089917 TaxID=3155187 RepID=UPI0034372BBD